MAVSMTNMSFPLFDLHARMKRLIHDNHAAFYWRAGSGRIVTIAAIVETLLV